MSRAETVSAIPRFSIRAVTDPTVIAAANAVRKKAEMNRVLHECAANLHIWIEYDVVDDAPLATGHGATTEAAPLRANARATLLHAHGNEPPH